MTLQILNQTQAAQDNREKAKSKKVIRLILKENLPVEVLLQVNKKTNSLTKDSLKIEKTKLSLKD